MKYLTRFTRMESKRWAFNFHKWNPGKQDWMTCNASIQPEEKERISNFVFQKDAKASMVGRLMMRKLVSDHLCIPWSEVKLKRSEKGRPYLLNENESFPLNFNVSHQGQWAILAAETTGSIVGCDIMRIEKASNKNTSEFFRLMRRQFTAEEWRVILSGESEQIQLELFYRNWCLKEAFVKSLGVGVTYDLQSLSFLTFQKLCQDKVVTDTKVKVNGTIASGWHFQEILIDDQHIATTAIQGSGKNVPFYKTLEYQDLIDCMQQIAPFDEEAATNFTTKSETPWAWDNK